MALVMADLSESQRETLMNLIYQLYNMGKHNLVLWLDYTQEATTYHTPDMSMWGAVRYRRTFSYDDCNMVQSKYSPSTYRTKMPIHSGNGFFTEFWYDPQALDTAH